MAAGTILGIVRGGLILPGIAHAGASVGAGADFMPVGRALGMAAGTIPGMVLHGAGVAVIGDIITIIIMQLRIQDITMDVLPEEGAMQVLA